MKLFGVTFLACLSPLMAQTICQSNTNTFTAKVNLYAGELGYYEFEECEGTNPTIGMKVGETYTFIQKDVSNYYHPIGFAYEADGAHDGVDELEPSILRSNPNDSCTTDNTCPAPMYYKDGTSLGKYDNLVNPKVGNADFGLDFYEPEFFYPLADWSAANYTIKLKFDDAQFDKDIFYFCHIHQFMTGRIKLLDPTTGVAITSDDSPSIPYAYDTPSTFDAECGTFGLDTFQASANEECPDQFVCDVNSDDYPEVYQFSKCIDAMDCRMVVDMTQKLSDIPDEKSLFLQQMIPHHQNAVNMAKALLNPTSEFLTCSDITSEDDDCGLEVIAREIVNNQNFQIQVMRGLLGKAETMFDKDCKINISGSIDSGSSSDSSDSTTAPDCFSPATTAMVKGRGSIHMDMIEVGDQVLTGKGTYETIYAFDHRDTTKDAKFLQIFYEQQDEPLEITNKHMVFLDGNSYPVPANIVKVGDKIRTVDGPFPVTKISTIARKGVFNPLTVDGTIIVNGIISSSYSSLESNNESIEAFGRKLMSYQNFFDALLKPYSFICTTVSLNLCKTDNKKVMISDFASTLFLFQKNSIYQTALLSLAIVLASILNIVSSISFLMLAPAVIGWWIVTGRKFSKKM